MSTVYHFGSSPITGSGPQFTNTAATAGSCPALLGNYAKSITPNKSDQQNSDHKAHEEVRALRAERYRLLSCCRQLLIAAGKRANLKHPHDFHRTAKCRFVQHLSDYVRVHLSQEHRSAFYSGLVTCGSLWACPVCASKIQERRRVEIAKAIEWVHGANLQAMMVTLTFPHYRWQKLAKLLEQQAFALQRLRAGEPWQRFKQAVGFQGLIRALELTHGAHGWHPHTHELWIVRRDADPQEVKAEVIARWESACRRAGLLTDAQADSFRRFAVDVRGHCSASDYLAKQDRASRWGVDREIAKAETKAGRGFGLHPLDLLAKAADGDLRSQRLYLAYVLATKGRRQICWSRGLKSLVGVQEKSDEALAEEQRDHADLLGLISPEDWQRIRAADVRALVLTEAERAGWPGVQRLIQALQ